MSAPHEFDKSRYQRFEIGNDGKEIIRNFKIVYGKLTIPHGTNFDEIPPAHRTIGSESQVVPIPATAEVSWHSADGKMHSVSVPVRELITDMSVFYGFKFFFVDDRLDVYLISEKRPRRSEYLETVATKVFSK
jgi:hypothetical protein